MLAGLIAGLGIHFYAVIRGVITAAFLYLVGAYCIKIIIFLFRQEQQSALVYLKKISFGIVFVSLGLIIGLGPTITKLKSSQTYSQVGMTKLIFHTDEFKNRPLIDKASYIWHIYEQSLLTTAVR